MRVLVCSLDEAWRNQGFVVTLDFIAFHRGYACF